MGYQKKRIVMHNTPLPLYSLPGTVTVDVYHARIVSQCLIDAARRCGTERHRCTYPARYNEASTAHERTHTYLAIWLINMASSVQAFRQPHMNNEMLGTTTVIHAKNHNIERGRESRIATTTKRATTGAREFWIDTGSQRAANWRSGVRWCRRRSIRQRFCELRSVGTICGHLDELLHARPRERRGSHTRRSGAETATAALEYTGSFMTGVKRTLDFVNEGNTNSGLPQLVHAADPSQEAYWAIRP